MYAVGHIRCHFSAGDDTHLPKATGIFSDCAEKSPIFVHFGLAADIIDDLQSMFWLFYH